MIQLSTNALRVEAQLAGKSAEFPRAVERGVERVIEIAKQQKTRKISRTYARAIPRGKKTNRPLWKRSNDWQRGQLVQKKGRFGRELRTVGRAEVYEPVLATLPRSKRDGVNRQNAAATDAVAVVRPQVQPVFEQEIRNALDL